MFKGEHKRKYHSQRTSYIGACVYSNESTEHLDIFNLLAQVQCLNSRFSQPVLLKMTL